MAEWIVGPPRCPGFWIVQHGNKDHEFWSVEWDEREDGTRYLRMHSSGGDSQEVNDFHDQWPLIRSFGPVDPY